MQHGIFHKILVEFLCVVKEFCCWQVIGLALDKIIAFFSGNSNKSNSKEIELNRKSEFLQKKETALNAKEESLFDQERQLDYQNQMLDQKAGSLKIKETELKTQELSFETQKAQFHSLVNTRAKNIAIDLAHDIASRQYLLTTPAFQSLLEDESRDRLRAVLSKSMHISHPFNITAGIVSSSGNSYRTSLYECSCPDFQYRHKPCKHMQRLAIETGFLMTANSSLTSETNNLLESKEAVLAEINSARLKSEKALQKMKQTKTALSEQEAKLLQDKTDFEHLLAEKQQCYPWLSKLIADRKAALDLQIPEYLLSKDRSAPKKADELSKLIKGDLRDTRQKLSRAEYQLHYYESLFPWLLDFKEIPPVEAFDYISDAPSADDEYELMKSWLSLVEWKALSAPERDQLALDRYIRRKKNNWDVGIEYERYIGYLCESQGYSVDYNGATARKEDMGRDLILKKGNRVVLIQCKRWAQEKVIHENHVFQLAGSVFQYMHAHPEKEVIGAFVATNTFSSVAAMCAEHLNIRLFPNIPYQEYPRIKCNIGRSYDGIPQKIYHLPMDQQYDAVKIDVTGEFYAWTVQEAIDAGFRRAYKWHGSKQE